jgi:hypothetical protein
MIVSSYILNTETIIALETGIKLEESWDLNGEITPRYHTYIIPLSKEIPL